MSYRKGKSWSRTQTLHAAVFCLQQLIKSCLLRRDDTDALGE
jgi:hypothetical protein